jgi:hypothetical protein
MSFSLIKLLGHLERFLLSSSFHELRVATRHQISGYFFIEKNGAWHFFHSHGMDAAVSDAKIRQGRGTSAPSRGVTPTNTVYAQRPKKAAVPNKGARALA